MCEKPYEMCIHNDISNDLLDEFHDLVNNYNELIDNLPLYNPTLFTNLKKMSLMEIKSFIFELKQIGVSRETINYIIKSYE